MAALSRGRVEIFLSGEAIQDSQARVNANPKLAQKYLESIESIRHSLPEAPKPTLEYILTLPGVFEVAEPEIDCEVIRGPVMELLDKALEQTVRMRIEEGGNLESELRRIIQQIEDYNNAVKNMRMDAINSYRQKMIDRLQQFELQMNIDDHRIAQEIAFMADRSDICEETARMESHIDQFRKLLDSGGESPNDVPVGRRLDFLCQEMFREINTMGSKTQYLPITQIVLELKSSVDQLREQVQNVE